MRLNLPPVLVAAGALIAREAYEAVAAPARCARRSGLVTTTASPSRVNSRNSFSLSRLAGLLTCSLNS